MGPLHGGAYFLWAHCMVEPISSGPIAWWSLFLVGPLHGGAYFLWAHCRVEPISCGPIAWWSLFLVRPISYEDLLVGGILMVLPYCK